MRDYIHVRIQTKPLTWQSVCEQIVREWPDIAGDSTELYGIWRNQIGRHRDELNLIALPPVNNSLPDIPLNSLDNVVSLEAWPMSSTLRPLQHAPPRQQGNYAFRHFQTDPENWDEFLRLCAQAWPGFEAAYPDCKVVGLWRYHGDNKCGISSVMLTRRPNLMAWERTKIPQSEAEAEVRRTLSRRYDLCTSTYVHTTTLLTATDEVDTTRWA